MRARKSDALEARHVVDRFEQPRKIATRIIGRLIVIHDLTEKLHLFAARIGRFPNLCEDVGLRAHAFVAARIGHDAEAAELVAAFDDGDVRLHRVAAPGESKRERHVGVRIEIE